MNPDPESTCSKQHLIPLLQQSFPPVDLDELSPLFKAVNPLHFYKFRIHCEFVEWPQMTDFLSKNPFFVFLVKETEANRDHYQGLLWCVKVKEQQIRNKIKAAFPGIKGNTGYSLSPCLKKSDLKPDIIRYIQYLCKGKSRAIPPEIVINDFQIIDIGHAHLMQKQYWDEFDKKCKDNPKKYKKSLKQLVLENLTQEQLDTLTTMDGQSESESRLMYKVISLIVRHKLRRSAHPTSITNILFNLLLDQNPKFEAWHYTHHSFFWHY